MIQSEPQILLISMQLGSCIAFFLNFHAPQADARDPDDPTVRITAQTRNLWRHKLYRVCKCVPRNALLFLTCDANATVGSFASPVSSTLDPEEPNANTDFFLEFLARMDMIIPAHLKDIIPVHPSPITPLPKQNAELIM